MGHICSFVLMLILIGGVWKLWLCYLCVCVWGVWENPDDTARAVIFPQYNINSLLVWGDGGQAGALKGGSHLHTTAHSCPPGPAKAPGRLTGCVYTHMHLSSSSPSHLYFYHLSPHLFSNFSPHQGPLGSGLCPHHAWLHKALALADSPPLTTVERHDAHVYSDTLFWFLTGTHTHETSAFLENYKTAIKTSTSPLLHVVCNVTLVL